MEQQKLAAIRTDLAVESNELAMSRMGRQMSGVEVDEEDVEGAHITRILVRDPRAGAAMGKVPGRYITVEAPSLRERDRTAQEQVGLALAKELERMLGLKDEDETSFLIVGLGNWNATPDAVGPKVVNKVLVTRHMFQTARPDLKGGLRPVSALAPGVLGITGIETAEIILGVVQKTGPDMVIAVDALAARSTDRLGITIQVADVGINPGSGVGNRRFGITKETLGVPVIAVGVPTVVDAVTIATDAMDAFEQSQGRPPVSENPRGQDVLRQVLGRQFGTLIVTPKEVDVLIDDIAKVIAGALNMALHPAVGPDEVWKYIH